MERRNQDAPFHEAETPGPPGVTGAAASRRSGAARALKTVLKLILASLAAGWLLSLLGTDALGFLRWLSRAVHGLVELVGDFLAWSLELAGSFLEWGVSYVLLGAIVVVPLFLVRIAWRQLKRR